MCGTRFCRVVNPPRTIHIFKAVPIQIKQLQTTPQWIRKRNRLLITLFDFLVSWLTAKYESRSLLVINYYVVFTHKFQGNEYTTAKHRWKKSWEFVWNLWTFFLRYAFLSATYKMEKFILAQGSVVVSKLRSQWYIFVSSHVSNVYHFAIIIDKNEWM